MNIVLGISGSIAAYKAADLASQLVKQGHEVHVVMTRSATEFITPLTLQTLTRQPVLVSLEDEKQSWKPGHIDLADRADLLLVAPATANVIGNFANGLASDPLSSIYLALPRTTPVLIAPAMNGKEYERPAYPSTWARKEGNGRVWYTAMGHREDVWTNPIFQNILIGGIQWALGQVQADVPANLKEVAPEAMTNPPYVEPKPKAPVKPKAK